MPKRKKKQPKKDKEKASKVQKSLFSNNHRQNSIVRLNQPSLMVEKNICLTDEIYGANPPEHLKGHHFMYKVVAYDAEKKRFRATFQLRTIPEDGWEWKVLAGEREPLDDLKEEVVKDGLELYNKALGRINAHDYEKTAVARAALKKKSSGSTKLREEDVDMTDLDEAAVSTKQGWMSQEVIEVSCSLYLSVDLRLPLFDLTFTFVQIF